MAILDTLAAIRNASIDSPFVVASVVGAFVLGTIIVYLEIQHRELGNVPGPIIARYTNAWRCYYAWKYSERPSGLTYHEVIHQRYGNIVRVGPKTVFVNDPAAIPYVLGFKDRLEKTDSVIPFMIPGKPTSIVGIRNEQRHAAYRRPISGAFSLSSLRLYEPAIDSMIEKLYQVFDLKAAGREIINATEWCHFFAYDTIMNITFGSPIGFLEKGEDVDNLIDSQVKHVAYVRVLTQWPALDWVLRTNPLVLAMKPHKESPFFRFAVKMIKKESERQQDEETPKRTLLQHFIDSKKRYPEVVDDTQIRLYCATNALAGSLSPSRTLDCICAWLARHPEAQDRLYAEITRVTTQLPIPFLDSQKMPYLEGVIREGYRLHHGGDIAIERKAGPDGVDLPDGTRIPPFYDVAMSSPSIRVCEGYGPDPLVYRPERWMQAKDESDEDFIARRTYMDKIDLTFSQGSRACIGKNFTHLELFKAVASIMGKYKFELAGATERFSVPVRLIPRHAALSNKQPKDIYPGDRTVAAATRLQAQHNVSKHYLGGLVHAPFDLTALPAPRILDCGTADGFWLYDLQKSLNLDPSKTLLVGADIGTFPDTTYPRPENLSLHKHSYKDPWPADWQGTFDFVHMRFCIAGLADPTEAQLAIDRLIGLLKPGGWIQLVDSTLPSESIQASDQPSVKLFKAMGAMLRSRGQCTSAGLRIRGLLEGAKPSLEGVDGKSVVAKLGAGAPTQGLREDGLGNLMKMMDTLGTKIDDMPNPPMSSLDLEKLRSELVAEVETTGADKPYYAVWGRKPVS